MKIVLGVEPLLWPPLTGVGHYTRHLLDGLLSARGAELRCMADYRFTPPPPPGAAGGAAAGPGLTLRLKRLAARAPGVERARFAVRDAVIRRRAPAIGDAVYHEPNHILRSRLGPSVVTVHDLSVLHHPAYHPSDRVRYFERNFARSAESADLVIVDSAFIRADLRATLGLDPARIRVVPLGVGAEFRPLAEAETAEALARRRLARGGYVLALGTREPRKNLERLIDAYLDLPPDLRAHRPLVLAGAGGWRSEALERRVAALERDGAVRSLGYVPDGERAALYAGASAFAYPSLYEGFGLPPLEAAACGTPVLTSAGSPMAETLEGVAELADPADAAAITSGLERVLTDPAIRARAALEGPRRAATLTWRRCVEATMAVYGELGESGPATPSRWPSAADASAGFPAAGAA